MPSRIGKNTAISSRFDRFGNLFHSRPRPGYTEIHQALGVEKALEEVMPLSLEDGELHQIAGSGRFINLFHPAGVLG